MILNGFILGKTRLITDKLDFYKIFLKNILQFIE